MNNVTEVFVTSEVNVEKLVKMWLVDALLDILANVVKKMRNSAENKFAMEVLDACKSFNLI